MRDTRESEEIINVWPSFSDIMVGFFMFLSFILVTLVLRDYLTLQYLDETVKRLSQLEELVGKVENDMVVLKILLKEENVEVTPNGKIIIQS